MATLKTSYKHTRKGALGQIVQEIYLRSDVSSGYVDDPFNQIQTTNILSFEQDEKKEIYILDYDTVVNQIDVVENCHSLQNVVLMQTVVEYVKKKKPSAYTTLKTLADNQLYRKFYIFANEFCQETFVGVEKGQSLESQNERTLLKAVQWYDQRFKPLKIDIIFITNSINMFKVAQQMGIKSLTIFDYVKSQAQDQPELMDYLALRQNIDQKGEGDMQEEKNNFFKAHIQEDTAINMIQSGVLLRGKLMIDRNNSEIGKIMMHKYQLEIKILGKLNQNRALCGDIVAIEILPESEWAENKVNLIEDQIDEQDTTDFTKDHLSKEAENNLQILMDQAQKLGISPTGRIVSIVQRSARDFCGHITVDDTQDINKRNKVKSMQYYRFVPADSRYPHFYIRLTQNSDLINQKIVFAFDFWPENSILPFGHYQKTIGINGDTFTEGSVILLEHNVEIRPFSKAVLDCLPQEGVNWQISKEQLSQRLDLRHLDVVSIDPIGCKDIDDALHCVLLENGNFEVGVHIADVSHFVRPDTPIDREAAHRCTTVYLVDRRTDMLPKLLTETLCSLISDVDRCSFSVIWEMDKEARIISTKYSKTVIRSRFSLNYGQAQKMMDDQSDQTNVTKSIRYLNHLAKQLKTKRFEAGALSLASTQVKFSFSDETHNPTDVTFYQMYETNSLIEQFMLLGNIAVAQKIFACFPAVSILRHHSNPKPKQIKEMAVIMEKLGFKFDYSTNQNLAETLDQIQRPKDQFFNKMIRIMATRTMNQALYFCTADADYPEFYHYGLAATLYTHFTSPIRRYADVLVHRQLAAAIDIDSLPDNMSNQIKMTKVCEKMNMRHRNARFASRASSDYHTYLFFKDQDIVDQAIVNSVLPQGISVLLPRYGLEGIIEFTEEEQLQNQKLKQDQTEVILDFYLGGKVMKLFDYIKVSISVGLKNFHKQIHLKFIEKIEQK